jgi:hypothetical protein
MRDLRVLDSYRRTDKAVIEHYGTIGDDKAGVFSIPSPIDRVPMLCIVSSGEGWDHVSVSRANRCPNWPEMEHVKRMFFKEDEVCMQLHVATADHISIHPNCLHIWRPTDQAIPLPPKEFVG